MKKRRFLAFLCALIPGAGQMYLGYLHRGLWHMSVFAFCTALTSLLELFGLALPVLWAFAFFDTFSLISRLDQGETPPDCNPFGLDEAGSLGAFLKKRHALLGWLLILVGGYVLLDRFVLDALRELFSTLGLDYVVHLLNSIPTFLLAAALVALGLWLIGGRIAKEPQAPAEPDFRPYTPPKDPLPEIVPATQDAPEAPAETPEAHAEEEAGEHDE